jgi:hypothetical protein
VKGWTVDSGLIGQAKFDFWRNQVSQLIANGVAAAIE